MLLAPLLAWLLPRLMLATLLAALATLLALLATLLAALRLRLRRRLLATGPARDRHVLPALVRYPDHHESRRGRRQITGLSGRLTALAWEALRWVTRLIWKSLPRMGRSPRQILSRMPRLSGKRLVWPTAGRQSLARVGVLIDDRDVG